MLKKQGYWLTAFNDQGNFHIRYHPEIGCGQYYNGGLDSTAVRLLADTIRPKLEQLLETKIEHTTVSECQYDGVVAEYWLDNNLNWQKCQLAIDQLDPELSDLCVEYVDFTMENQDD